MDALRYLMAQPELHVVVWLVGFTGATLAGSALSRVMTT